MKVLNFGSLNIDYVYSLDHFVRAGETVSSDKMEKFCGGKGLNQSAALAKAGAMVYHAGMIGQDGLFLAKALQDVGADTSLIRVADASSGHAIIQVEKNGQNSIILYSGTNGAITADFAHEVLQKFNVGDWLLLQNEISSVGEIMRAAYEKGMKIAFNPSPMTDAIHSYPMECVSLFFVNEIEGSELTGETEEQEICKKMAEMYPNSAVVLTLGAKGAIFSDGKNSVFQPAMQVKAVDTTAAGDTFTGFFLSSYMLGEPPEKCLKRATAASALAVSRMGALPSIPDVAQVEEFLKQQG